MSRPDNPMTQRPPVPEGWPRPQDTVHRDAAPPRPAPTARDQWPPAQQQQRPAAAGYHMPAQAPQQAAPDHNYLYPQERTAPPTARQRPQAAAQPEYAPRQEAQQVHADPRLAGWPDDAAAPRQPYQAPQQAQRSPYPAQHPQQQPAQSWSERQGAPAAHQAPPLQRMPSAAPQAANGGYWAQQQKPDPVGYEQGGYVPQTQGHAGYRGADPLTAHPQADTHFGQSPAPQYAEAQHGQFGGQAGPNLGIDGYAPQGQQYQVGGDLQAEAGYEGEDYAEEEPRRGRTLLVVGALVFAMLLGGGGAFAYKMLAQGNKRSGSTPVVQRSSTPAKVAANDPGGRQFENQNKKFFDRVPGGEPRPSSAAAPQTQPMPTVPGMIVSGGIASPPPAATTEPAEPATGNPKTRMVQTVPVGPDGAPRVQPSVPGLVMDSGPGAGQPTQAAAPEPPAAPVMAAPAPTRPAPQRMAAAATAAAPVKKPVPKATASTAPATPSSGYVVVLASQKDRLAALKAFADLQQKYPDLLGDKQPEVLAKDLGEAKGGVWQRLVAGPAGSKQAAAELCTQLKAAGYASCWVSAH
jgi:SPOR domain